MPYLCVQKQLGAFKTSAVKDYKDALSTTYHPSVVSGVNREQFN